MFGQTLANTNRLNFLDVSQCSHISDPCLRFYIRQTLMHDAQPCTNLTKMQIYNVCIVLWYSSFARVIGLHISHYIHIWRVISATCQDCHVSRLSRVKTVTRQEWQMWYTYHSLPRRFRPGSLAYRHSVLHGLHTWSRLCTARRLQCTRSLQ